MIKNIKRKINKDKGIIISEDMSKEEDCSEKEILDKIKTDSEIQYKQKIKNDMIEYMKKNKDIKYEEWLRGFNVLDWEQEFNYESEKRENVVYLRRTYRT